MKYEVGSDQLARSIPWSDHVYHIGMICFTAYVGFDWAKSALNKIDRSLFTFFMVHRIIAVVYRVIGIIFNFALVWDAPNYLLFSSVAAVYTYLDLKKWQK